MTDFIDFHVHPPVVELFTGPVAPYLESLQRLPDADLEVRTVEDIASIYQQRNGKAVLLGWDAETATQRRPFSSKDVAGMVEEFPDVFFGFGSIDPARGARAVAGVHSAARLGLSGMAFHPIGQGFDPSAREAFPVYEAAADHGLVLLFHTGFSRLGSSMPGGTGLRLSHGDPRAVDEIAAEFPELQIVIAHVGQLWQKEAIAVAAHKANVWLNLVGSTAGDCLRELSQLTGIDFDRCLFGSDWCFSSLDAELDKWKSGSIEEKLRRGVLYDNAARLLGG
ncbi:MAG: amidohydrolase family protein [Actinomycetota bacterium]